MKLWQFTTSWCWPIRLWFGYFFEVGNLKKNKNNEFYCVIRPKRLNEAR